MAHSQYTSTATERSVVSGDRQGGPTVDRGRELLATRLKLAESMHIAAYLAVKRAKHGLLVTAPLAEVGDSVGLHLDEDRLLVMTEETLEHRG